GFKNSPQKQQQLINDSIDKLREFRNNTHKNKGNRIEITEKRPGTFHRLDESITVNEANPQAKIGIYDGDSGNIIVDGKAFNGELINWKKMISGYAYDIRRALANDNGEPTYVALPVDIQKINDSALSSISWAVKVHLSQNDSEGLIDDRNKLNSIQRKVKEVTGYDLYSAKDLDSYLRMFIQTVS